jgi:hypothetical protein
MAKKIKTVEELRKLSKDEPIDCFIALSGGICRSSKSVFYDSGEKIFSIINEIDDTEDILTEKELFTKSNVGEAIRKGAFFQYS